ncbi:MAG TPA: hypothetical protein VKB95_08195, partial [Chitinophagaceae bacterium]|nr:hypothetical protein [Chitinophagaceae bacterium]
EYKKVINLIRNFSNKVLSKKQIEDGLVALNTSLKFNPNDKPATILSYQKALNDVYNPQVNDRTKFFDETLILPLSSVWFEQTDPSTKQSDPKLLSSLDKLKEWLVGNAGGEGLADPDQRLPDVKAELLNIKEYVDQTIVRNSPEAKWLQTLSPESLTKIKRIIFVHSETWNYSLGQKHVSGIAIQNSFGAFNLHPVINVLLHELTVNGGGSFLKFAKGTSPDGAGVDTHIPVQYTQATWDKVSKGGLGSLRGDEDFIDHLYQSHRALASIALAIIISKISNE